MSNDVDKDLEEYDEMLNRDSLNIPDDIKAKAKYIIITRKRRIW